MPDGNTASYKLVVPGNFVVSLRSFQGGLEYSSHRGLVSPAYTVLTPKTPICPEFYKHYFKSYEFIGRLAVAVIGIRDGKQVSYNDFSFLRIPVPPIDEQRQIAKVLDVAKAGEAVHQNYLQGLLKQKRGLMQKLLTGQVRVAA